MRTPFVAPCLLLLAAGSAACAGHAGGGLPGFPLAGPEEAEGPEHIQRLCGFEEESIVIEDRLMSEGRPPRTHLLRVSRGGAVLDRRDLHTRERELEEPRFHPLPLEVGDHLVEGRRRSGRWEILLRDPSEPAVEVELSVLPRAHATGLEGVALGPDPGEGPAVAALAWSSVEDGARVRGIIVLDLRNGRARLLQRRGLDALKEGDQEAAADHFQSAWDMDPEDPVAAYNLSCALARLGRDELSLDRLADAVRIGGQRIRALAGRDPDLERLRDHPCYAEIMGLPLEGEEPLGQEEGGSQGDNRHHGDVPD
ncbi:MAG: tetratricopeptide repeat protein [Myxococcota bacterium]